MEDCPVIRIVKLLERSSLIGHSYERNSIKNRSTNVTSPPFFISHHFVHCIIVRYEHKQRLSGNRLGDILCCIEGMTRPRQSQSPVMCMTMASN